MPSFNVQPNSKRTLVMAAQAAAQTTLTSTAIYTQDFQTTVFDTVIGTSTTGQVTTVKIQGGNLANLSDMADLAGSHITLVDPASNLMISHEIVESQYQYLQVVILRTVQNVGISAVVATQYGSHRAPTVDDPTTVQARLLLVSPAQGTA
jgi:hypothetical protein